jgi:glycosyltransferase involved in cell wall biosynthesis
MKYCSINIVHYSKIDDFNETAAGNNPPKRSELIRRCLDSIDTSTFYPAEINVWDNGGDFDDTDYLVQMVRKGVINHLVRSKNNMNFAYAWNTLAKISTGDYMCFMCNDIEVADNWLTTCVKILEDYPDRQWVATPFITYDKKKHTLEVTPEGYRVNMRSGSNCMIMRTSDWPKLGEFPNHKKGGSLWYTKNFREGWRFTAPPVDMAFDMGFRHGTNFNIPIQVIKKLTDGSEIHFEEKVQQ